MSQIFGLSDSDVCLKLREAAAISKLKIEKSKQSMEQKEALDKRIAGLKTALERVSERESLVNKNMKLLKTFVQKKRTKAIKGVHASIYNTNQILPATGKIQLIVNNGEAFLNGEDDLDVDLCEASSWRATASVYIRRAILANTSYSQVMLLDEPLSVLDDYSSADFSLFLEPLAKDCLIILVEQKNSVFSNADVLTYVFEKIEGVTHVRRLES